MSKTRKKRNKRYAGEDAKVEQATVHRYTAVDRGKFGQWWFEKKTIVKRIALFGGGGLVVIFLLVEAIRSLF